MLTGQRRKISVARLAPWISVSHKEIAFSVAIVGKIETVKKSRSCEGERQEPLAQQVPSLEEVRQREKVSVKTLATID